MRRVVVLLAAVMGGCGGDSGTPAPDAPISPDAMPDAPGFAACREFSAIGLGVPVHIVSSLAGADVQSPSGCESVDAPFGVESAGPDSVFRVDGLIVGSPYIVRVSSGDDLAFYVASGCSTPSGPGASECSLFVDASSATRESGRFIASAKSEYVVVDYYDTSAPTDSTFTLDVYAEACSSDAQCSGPTPACVDGTCVECDSSFDCADAAKPVCNQDTNLCSAGSELCISDDVAEPANDGPSGATQLIVDGTGFASATGAICQASSPIIEADFYKLTVTTLGDTWDIALDWSGNRDLDLRVYDERGTAVGLSFWEHPEGVRLTYLPLGTYYVRINNASPVTSTSIDYTLSIQRTAGAGCTMRAQCAVDYRNQLYRGDCVAGACVRIDGAAEVAEGSACDSVSDCASGLACPSFFFTADADTRDVCARTCTNDAGCSALGGGYVCSTYLETNLCVQKCTTDDQCPTTFDPPSSGPWYRLRCDLQTGKCI